MAKHKVRRRKTQADELAPTTERRRHGEVERVAQAIAD